MSEGGSEGGRKQRRKGGREKAKEEGRENAKEGGGGKIFKASKVGRVFLLTYSQYSKDATLNKGSLQVRSTGEKK